MNASLENAGRVVRRPVARRTLGREVAGLVLLFLMVLSCSGCLVRSRERIAPAGQNAAFRQATLEELLAQLRQHEEAIQTLNATVDIEPSVRSAQRGEVVHYRDVRSFLLIRKPGWLRMIGLYPVVRNTAFDLASNGESFELYVPSRNRLVVGSNHTSKRSASALENLRPQHILDAVLWKSPEAGKEQAAVEVVNEADQSYYVIHVLATAENGTLTLARRLWFERLGLTLERLQIFDAGGVLATDARYSNYGEFSGVRYPQRIEIDRPQDAYGLLLVVTRLVFNETLGEEKFQMERPAGAEVVSLDARPAGESLTN